MVDVFDLAGLDQVGGLPIGAETFESKDGVGGGIDGGSHFAIMDTLLRGRAIRGG